MIVKLARLAIAAGLVLMAGTTQAEVRFRRNVRVGGHDFSNQTFNRNRRAGCVWRADGRGGKVKICHLRRIR